MDASQLDELRSCVAAAELHAQELRRVLQEFGQKGDSDNPQGVRASQSVDRSSPNDAVQQLLPERHRSSRSSPSVDRSSRGATTSAVPAEPEPAEPEIAREGVAIAVHLAQQALHEAESKLPSDAQNLLAVSSPRSAHWGRLRIWEASEQLAEAQNLLAVSSPPSTRQTAQAYACVQHAWHLVLRARSGAEKPAKDAALVVRELFVLQCCIEQRQEGFQVLNKEQEAISKQQVEASWSQAFERMIDGELNSQLHLARNGIARIARGGRAAFDQAVLKVYGRLLSTDHTRCLRAAYVAAATTMGPEVGLIKDPAAGGSRPAKGRRPGCATDGSTSAVDVPASASPGAAPPSCDGQPGAGAAGCSRERAGCSASAASP